MSQHTIRDIRCILTRGLVVVKVETDDPDLYGVGCGTFTYRSTAIATVVHDYLKPFLVGKDPSEIEDIWQSCMVGAYWRNGPILNNALSGVDMALWDIKGKRLGVPVWDLLGGKVRDRVRGIVLLGSYGEVGTLSSPESYAQAARRAKSDGYTALKMTPFPSNWGEMAHGELIRQNTAIVQAVREEVGWDFDIGIEIHRNMNPGSSVVFAQQIEEFLPYFYEDPIAPDSVMSMGAVGKKTNLPLAVGERNNTLWEFREYCTLPGVSFLKPDIGLAGGFTHVKKIAAVAESFHQRILPHHFLGPIANMALAHIATATPNWDMNEFIPESGTFKADIVTNVTDMKDGYFIPSDAPGLGIDINIDEMLKHPYEAGGGETSRRSDGSLTLG